MRRNGELAAGALALMLLAAPAPAQQTEPAAESPESGGAGFDGVYPVRLLTVEGGRMLEGGDAIVGLGDTRWAVPVRSVELITNTLSDILGIANLAVKLGLLEGEGSRPAVAVGVKAYRSYGGLIDTGVRRAVESFATVTDSDVEVAGWVAYAAATWSVDAHRTHLHAALQTHQPIDSKFRVEDSEAGGGGSVEFLEGDDVSAMGGVDHRLAGRAVVLVLEAGYSFGLERPRFGAGLDLGGERMRVLLGASYPGVETDLATEPRDFVVTPALSVHYRF